MSYSPEALEAFAQTVASGSFSAAARRLGKSQSTVSESISRLEIDLGLELFDRSSKHPVLTEAGRAMLGRIEDVLAASDKLRRAAGRLAEGMDPLLRWCCPTPISLPISKPVWRSWTNAFPSWSWSACLLNTATPSA
jgi:DNA-binding transcriptional LysR family regulator